MAKGRRRESHTVLIFSLCLHRGALYGCHLQWTDLGQHVEQSRQRPCSDACLATILIPVIFRRQGCYFLAELRHLRRVWIGRLTLAMEKRDGIGNAGNEAAHCKVVGTDIDAPAASAGEILRETVRLVIGQRKLLYGYFEAYVFQVMAGRHAMVRDLVDVERELGLHMLMLALGIVDEGAIFCTQLGKLDRDGEVGGERMPFSISDVVRKRTHGERKFVGIAGVTEEVDDEVAGTHVVSEVRKGRIAKRVIADVLDNAPTVRIGPGVFQFRRRERGIATQEQRDDRRSEERRV